MKKLKLLTALLLTFGAININAQQVGIDFDGTDDVIVTPVSSFTGDATRTVEIWFNRTYNSNPAVMVDMGDLALSERFTVKVQSTHVRVETGGSGNAIEGTTYISASTWHHLAVVYDNTLATNKCKIYLNGALEIEGDFAAINTSSLNNIHIGGRWNGVTPFEGKLDEVRIWNTARTATEILDNMNDEFCSTQTGLIAYYKMNDGVADVDNTAITTVVDEVNGNDGVLTNFALMGTSSNFIEGNVNLNTNNPITTNQTLNECDGYSITVGMNTYTQTGVYTDILTSIDGCDSTVTTDLTVAAPLSSSQTLNECEGFSITVGTNTYDQTGNYTDVLTSVISGCDSTVTTNLTINTIDNTVSQASITLTANATGLSYQWLDCDNANAPIVGETNIDFTPTENGNYSVEITDGNCVDTSDCMLIASVGITQNELNDSFKLFPNPANNQINISFNNQIENVNIEIINMVGQTVKNLGNISQTTTVNVSDLPKGTYLIKLQSNDGVAVKKFQKQ